MELYLIRHAQSTNQLLDEPDARVFDPPLTDLGRQQAALLAEHLETGSERMPLSRGGLSLLACSPMWRALETAHSLGQALDLAPEVWVDVHEQVRAEEIKAGSTRERIQDAFPHYALPEEITERGWWNRREESHSETMERAIRVAGQLWRRTGSDERLAVVSHARFIDSLLKALLDQLPGYDLWYHHFNTGVTRLGLGERLDVRYQNRVDHLPSTMIS